MLNQEPTRRDKDSRLYATQIFKKEKGNDFPRLLNPILLLPMALSHFLRISTFPNSFVSILKQDIMSETKREVKRKFDNAYVKRNISSKDINIKLLCRVPKRQGDSPPRIQGDSIQVSIHFMHSIFDWQKPLIITDIIQVAFVI